MASLPSLNDIFQQAEAAGLSLPVWKWPPMKPYNGFSHPERVRHWQGMHLAIRIKLIEPPSAHVCRMCGATERIQYHTEDYTTLEALDPLCQRCHFAVHRK